MLSTARELIEQFEGLRIAPAEFGHPQHVRLAWSYLEECPVPVALARFSEALQAFARHHGAEDKYHETITWAFVLLVNERRERLGRHDWPRFEEANPDLLTYRPSVLERYYRPGTLSSPLARRVFVLPDRSPAVTR